MPSLGRHTARTRVTLRVGSICPATATNGTLPPASYTGSRGIRQVAGPVTSASGQVVRWPHSWCGRVGVMLKAFGDLAEAG